MKAGAHFRPPPGLTPPLSSPGLGDPRSSALHGLIVSESNGAALPLNSVLRPVEPSWAPVHALASASSRSVSSNACLSTRPSLIGRQPPSVRAKAPLVVPVRSSTKQPVLNPSKDALNSSSAAALHANSEMPTFPRGAASAKVSFWSWAASLLRLLLATRTAFARFLLQTFKLSLGAEIAPPTALFPIPVPCPGCFGAGVPVFSSRRNPSSALRAVLLDRLLHITCMALNFLHSDGKPVPLESLRRQPNQAQLDMTGRLRSLLRASSRCPEDLPLCAGRRGVHLVSHLASLRDFLGRAGFVPSAYPGAARFEGYAAPCVDGPPALTPYRDVSPSRLLISGRGHWDIQPFLSPELWMPFVEPLVLRTIPPNSLPFPRALLEPAERTEELMKLWDSRGLLRLQPGPFSFRELCRVFAAFKNPEHDRMIGDRRGPNSLEGRVPGPSLLLPPGQMLVELTAKRGCQVVVGSSTDRSDFYHQILISRERARTNTIGPPLLLRDLADTRAHALFLADLASGCFPAEAKGCDGASCPRGGSVLDECLVFGSWASLFQGDHLGVEFATQAHERLLESHGLLDADHRLLSKRPVHHAGPWEALVIDDFFSISTASLSDIPADTGPSDSLLQTESARKVLQAKTAYASHDLKGSDHKDVLGSLTFKVAGASVDSSLATVRDGHVLVSAPVEKRLALAFVSLQAARLPSISRDLASGLAGSWVSTVLFRRCLMSCFDTFFALGKRAPSAPAGQFSEVVSLPRKAAGDLVLLSALAPVMCSDISTPFEESVFCSDSSLSKGAFCEAFVGERASSALWRSADKKGCSEPLAPAATAAEASAELLADPSPVPSGAAAPEKESLNKPLAMHYDFLEVFGGRGPVSSALAARGITNCLVLDLSVSRQFDLSSSRVVEWVLFLVQSGRVRSVFLSPPCASFAIAARPALRSVAQPWGFAPNDLRTFRGNRVACVAMIILRTCRSYRVPALLEQPLRSKMFWLPAFKTFACLPGAVSASAVSCAFGSSCSRRFRFLGCYLRISSLQAPRTCPSDLSHSPALGTAERATAACNPKLAAALAEVFLSAMSRVPAEDPTREGLENVGVNDTLLHSRWEVGRSWAWKEAVHINRLETDAAVNVLRTLALRGGDRRFTLFTRLNASDAPTRDSDLPEPSPSSVLTGLDCLATDAVFSLGGLTRARSGWVRLSLLLFRKPEARSALIHALREFPSASRFGGVSCVRPGQHSPLQFDKTLGFPGEGPCPSPVQFLCWLLLLPLAATSMPLLVPRNAADAARLAGRSPLGLPSGRKVLPRTSGNRAVRTAAFSQWLLEVSGQTLETALAVKPFDVEAFVGLLVEYGRDLYGSGRPYWHFEETVNAITSIKPVLRRQVQAAWDLAFAWLAEEPSSHHTALPAVLLLGLLTTCLVWGWLREAGVFALAWGGILRMGEVTSAYRSDLVLPSDVLDTQAFVLLRLREPKTRLRAARHQSARVDRSDLIELIALAFKDLKPHERLWPGSGQTLRRRLDAALKGLKVPKHVGENRPIDLGSFRPGGATFLLIYSEDPELVRRRGRWLSYRTMEVYLQEVTATTFFAELPHSTRLLVVQAARGFPTVLQQVKAWTAAAVPQAAWFLLFNRG